MRADCSAENCGGIEATGQSSGNGVARGRGWLWWVDRWTLTLEDVVVVVVVTVFFLVVVVVLEGAIFCRRSVPQALVYCFQCAKNKK